MGKKLNFTLKAQKMSFGKYAGRTVYMARPTDRERVTHRRFCEEVGRATTFTGAEVEAVLRLAAEIAKKHVSEGESVDFGDLGTLTPTFSSKSVEHPEEFDALKHISHPRVRLRPSKRYFTLTGVGYERAEPAPKKPSKPGGGTQQGGTQTP